jgi:allantoicase
MSGTEDDVTIFPNLASPALGATIVFATDEWFASAGDI